MRRAIFPALGALGLVMGGCIFTGGSPSKSPLANSPQGVSGVVTTRLRVYEGELLTVTKTDLTMRTSDGIVVIPYSRLEHGSFLAIDVGIDGLPSPTNLSQLRYASRYPYGIPDAALKAMLAKMGLSVPDTVRGP